MNTSLRKWIMAAVLAAIICVVTMALPIATPSGGYLNFGDCFVLLGGWLLGPWFGFAAAALGSGLADLLAGYAIYAPATAVIKGLMAVIAALIAMGFSKKRMADRIIGAVLAELWMVAGYFLYEVLLTSYGGALTGVPMNLLQGCVGAVSSVAVVLLLDRVGLIDKYFKK